MNNAVLQYFLQYFLRWKDWNGIYFMIKFISIILKLEFKILSWVSKCLKFIFKILRQKWLLKSKESMRSNSTGCAEECRTICGHMPYFFEADIQYIIYSLAKFYKMGQLIRTFIQIWVKIYQSRENLCLQMSFHRGVSRLIIIIRYIGAVLISAKLHGYQTDFSGSLWRWKRVCLFL